MNLKILQVLNLAKIVIAAKIAKLSTHQKL